MGKIFHRIFAGVSNFVRRNSAALFFAESQFCFISFNSMIKTLVLALLLFMIIHLDAQVNINNMATESSPFLCQPGVANRSPGKGASFTYSLNPDYKMRADDAESPSKVQRNERFDSKLKVPLYNSSKAKVLLGFEYTIERYHFIKINPDNYPLFKRLNEADLKNTGMAAYLICPINHKFYTSFRLSTNWQGDYTTFVSFDNRYAVYRAAGIFGVKKSENLEYGVGLLVSKGFRNTNVVPFGFYNHTFNRHWGVETAIPSSLKIRYNFDERRIAMFGTEFSSQNYALAVKEPVMNPFPNNQLEKAPYHYHRSSLDLVAMFYQQLTGWTWLQVKGGYAFNLNSEARDLPEKRTYDLQPSGSIVGMVSFFLSPPKHILEKN